MSVQAQFAPVVQTNVTGTGAVSILPASGINFRYRDLVGLVITTTNAAAATITISDGTKTVLVLNYPASAAVPTVPLVVSFGDVPLAQSVGNAAWTATVSANASGVNVSAQYQER